MVDEDVETSIVTGAVAVPALDVPPEPTMRPVPLIVTDAPATEATFPDADASEKLPPPNPPPPPPPPNPPPPLPPPLPPKPRPAPAPAPPAAGHGEAFPVITMARATIGPEAEPLEGGVPVTLTQLPRVTSRAVPATVWENVVADVHVTVVVPANWLDTFIDDPDTDATEPDATGRLVGVVVVEPPDEACGEPDALLQAAASTANEAAARAHPRARRRAGDASGFDNGSCMVPPLRPGRRLVVGPREAPA